MAWSDVPTKLAEYAAEEYAPPTADATLLNEYGAETLPDVPEHRREDFEADVDCRLGACRNIKVSRGKRWHNV